jgi:HPt (histidine-containing phosphotransfer) domain-containing protein
MFTHTNAMPTTLRAPDAPADLLDAASLQRLRELDPSGDNHVLERVLRTFESSLGRLLAQARLAQGADDLGTVRHVAHTLKSSSASVGALELSRRCADIESRLRTRHDDDIDALLDGIHAEGERVLVAVRALLPH